jgi:hypothetical protein
MDHWMVSVKFAPKDAPLIGSGRWTWPLSSIKNETLINTAVRKGIQIQTKIEELTNTPIELRNTSPQILWKDFKTDIQTMVKKELRTENYKIKT